MVGRRDCRTKTKDKPPPGTEGVYGGRTCSRRIYWIGRYGSKEIEVLPTVSELEYDNKTSNLSDYVQFTSKLNNSHARPDL